MQRQLVRLIAMPIIVIGVLAAVLTWELEHVAALLVGFLIAGGGVLICILVVRRVRVRIDALSAYYETLLLTADEQSRRAEAANRLKDDFLATLSHELRTPVNSVLGWARLLSSGRLDEAQRKKAVEAIERAGVAQSRLIEDLLDISRIVAGKMEIAPKQTAVAPLIDAAVHALAPATDAKRIVVETELDQRIAPIAADPDRLQQVVWNLLSNAIKFTPSGGHVHIGLTADDGDVRITVRDDGIGFNPDVAAHMFERFRQGDSSSTRPYGGLGLGLGIVRSIVELHGGTVKAESAGEGRGSVFSVCLPILSPADAAASERPARHTPALTGVSVLVVDDDPQQLEFVRAALEEYDASVTLASSAGEACDQFERQRPDVLLSDLLMPGADGIDLIRRIRGWMRRTAACTPAAAPHRAGARRRSPAGARRGLSDARRQTGRSVRAGAGRGASGARRTDGLAGAISPSYDWGWRPWS